MADRDATRLVLLGTAGGPLPSPTRAGIAQAVVVGGRVYLVDCGSDVTRQLRRARLLSSLHQVFLTHLHSDHDCDYFNVFLLGWPILQHSPPVQVWGPGSAGPMCALPAEAPGEVDIPLINPENPTPGIVDVTRYQFQAHAFDINIRMRDSGRTDLTTLVVPHEIPLPAGLGAAAPDAVAPPMSPVLVTEDDDVRVTAVLVPHAPVFPSFAFRFDTGAGSIVVSGDTAPSENLVALARGADILVHEVFDDAPDRRPDDDDWEAEQRRKHLLNSHTPLRKVGAIAARAGVGRLVLTHFIPGDDELPDEHWVKGAAGDFDGEVIAGRDLLQLVV
ncbi:MAG TPA: MBL fold metallo-hydrolase [Acidimicrobiales bacterium]|nr:MBL fold metallo-hydrolase [Acidimicrobiales bacterium]